MQVTTIPSEIETTASKSTALTWRTYVSSDACSAMTVWRQLSTRLSKTSMTTHPVWVQNWIDNYGDVVPFRFLVAEADGQVRGIALLTSGIEQKYGPFPVKTLHVGTAGEALQGTIKVEYNRLLVDPEFAQPFLTGLVDTINNDTSWEMFCLDGFSESDLKPWQESFPNAAIRRRESLYFDFDEARAKNSDVISLLGKSTRSNIRRRIKKTGKLEFDWATNLNEGAEIFEEMVELHQERWNSVGEPGAFANPRFLNFQRQLLVQLVTEEKLVLFRLRHEAKTVGCLMLLVDQNRLLDYLSGFESFDDYPSIGLITHYLCMEEALKRGYAAYDFLVGKKQHKNNLSTHSNHLCWMTMNRPSLKTKTVKMYRKMKRFIQGTSAIPLQGE